MYGYVIVLGRVTKLLPSDAKMADLWEDRDVRFDISLQ